MTKHAYIFYTYFEFLRFFKIKALYNYIAITMILDFSLNIQKPKIMACGPIISWQIDGETMETVRGFIFLGSKISADGDCSHEIKRCMLFERSYDKLRQHIKKQRHYFANIGLSSQGYGFSSGHV